MYSSTISTANIFISPGCFHPQFTYKSSLPIKIPVQKLSKGLSFNYTTRKAPAFFHQPYAPKRKTCAIWTKSGTESRAQPNESSNSTEDDFVTRVLKENPSQVEPKYLIGNKLYTLKEKENLRRNRSSDGGVFGLLKRLGLKELMVKKGDEGQNESGVNSGDVYLNDILREYKGKLYVPEQVFGKNISEEEEFDKNVEVLPRMTLEDFLKAMESDKIKLLTFKEDGVSSGFGFVDFVVELKEIPGDKSLQRTKW